MLPELKHKSSISPSCTCKCFVSFGDGDLMFCLSFIASMPHTCSFVQHHFGNESARINWMWLIQATHVASNGTGKVFMQLCCVGPSYPYYHLIQRCLSCVFEVAVVSLSLYVPQLLGMLCQILRTDSVPRCQEWLSDASEDRKTHHSSIIYTSFDFGGFASF